MQLRLDLVGWDDLFYSDRNRATEILLESRSETNKRLLWQIWSGTWICRI
jgi:hypothetical protein